MKRALLSLALAAPSGLVLAQNDCASALPVDTGTLYTVLAVSGTELPPAFCAPNGGNNVTHAMWYTYTAVDDTGLVVTTDLPQNINGDTRFHVFTGVCGALTCYAGDDDSGTGYLSTDTFDVAAGTTYTIVFDNRWSANGFDFVLGYAAPPPPPPPPPVSMFVPQTIPYTANDYYNCVVDMNNDGLDDVVGSGSTSVSITYQLPGGGFNFVTIPTAGVNNEPYWSECAGDLDGNGYNDLEYGGGGITLLMANDDGTAYNVINQPQSIFCQRTNMVDINNDGLLDAFTCHDVAPNCYYLNNGDGTFNFHQGGLGDTPDGGNYGSIWIDYDNDHKIDMFIAKCRGAGSPASIDQLHHNNGDGTFTDVAASMNLADYQQSWSSAWGDFDNDGDMDVLIGASSFSGGGHKLMRNDGTTFTNVTVGSGFDTYPGMSIEFVTQDFNNDGWLDILGGNGFFLNNGDMTFTQMYCPAGNGPIGDLNNDGFLDIENGNTVYFNVGNDSNYVRVITEGTVSNRSGIGARVVVTSALGTQIRDIRSGDGFRYMSSLTAHFGLGADTAIDNITVYWPSGLVSSIDHPAINTTHTIVEEQISTDVPSVPVNDLSVFPSPAQNTLYVRGAQDLNGRLVTVMDPSGKEVLRTTLRSGSIDVGSLTTGLYILRVQLKNTVLQGRFLKQ